MSAYGLANQLGVSHHEAKAYIDAYFANYPEVLDYMERTKEEARTYGYVMTPFGRKCYVGNMNHPKLRSFAERAAINAPIQGGEADVVKMAMIKVADEIKKHHLGTRMLLQVHDELVFEVPEDEIEKSKKLIQDVMENIVNLSVPLKVDVGVGKHWSDAH